MGAPEITLAIICGLGLIRMALSWREDRRRAKFRPRFSLQNGEELLRDIHASYGTDGRLYVTSRRLLWMGVSEAESFSRRLEIPIEDILVVEVTSTGWPRPQPVLEIKTATNKHVIPIGAAWLQGSSPKAGQWASEIMEAVEARRAELAPEVGVEEFLP